MDSGKMKGIMMFILLGYIVLIFIAQSQPSLESAASSDNITNQQVSSIFDIAVWVVPVLALVAVITHAVGGRFRSRRGIATVETMVLMVPVVGWITLAAIHAFIEMKKHQTRVIQAKK